ncbi:MAG: BatD family protein [Gemmatimonadales bacterium]
MISLAGAVLALALAGSVQDPQLVVSLDREELEVGEEAELLLEFTSPSEESAEFDLPPLPPGLQILGRAERTSVTFAPAVSRTSTLVLTLRAVRAGQWTWGPFEARQGSRFASAPPVEIEVTGGGAAQSVRVNPIVRDLLVRAPPPARRGEVALTLVLSDRRAVVGEQVDLVTAAWFPRDLRLKLRRPPTLQQPRIEGVWSVPQPVPVGIATSRRVGGQWYDLFITHQVVFPVSAGTVRIAPAELQYSVPVAYQFFSREERFTVTSEAVRLTVEGLPPGADGKAFSGPVGRRLRLSRSVRPSVAAVGEPVTVTYVLEGAGNIPLWPPPEVAWPSRVRVYDDGTEERTGLVNGLVSGSKGFRSLLVPDSAGTLVLPALRWPVYDVERRQVTEVSIPAAALTVKPRALAGAQRGLPPPLRRLGGPTWTWQLAHAVPPWVMALVVVVVPLMSLLPRIRVRRRQPRPERRARSGSLADAEHRLRRALAAYLPDIDGATDAELRLALDLAGLPSGVGAETVALRDRLRVARYGAMGVEDPGLVREIEEVVGQLGQGARQRNRRRVVTGAASVVFAVLASGVMAAAGAAQRDDATLSSEAGVLAGAAEACAARAAREPGAAMHWYNLGAAKYRMGEDAEAAAAWRVALRLEPRAGDVHRALRLVPPAGAASARELWSPPVTPDELLVAGVLLWIIGWALARLIKGVRLRRVGWGIVLLGATALAGSLGLRRWYDRPLVLVRATGPARVSPVGLAREVARLEAGAALERRQSERGFTLVATRRGPVGWFPEGALVPVPGYIFRWPTRTPSP